MHNSSRRCGTEFENFSQNIYIYKHTCMVQIQPQHNSSYRRCGKFDYFLEMIGRIRGIREQNLHVCVDVCLYVCADVCMCVCVCVCVAEHVCADVCLSVCVWQNMYVQMSVCLSVCLCVCVWQNMGDLEDVHYVYIFKSVCVSIRLGVHAAYVWVCVCVYIYIYIYRFCDKLPGCCLRPYVYIRACVLLYVNIC